MNTSSMSATVALASSALACPVQTVLHYALCFIRDVSSVSDHTTTAKKAKTSCVNKMADFIAQFINNWASNFGL